MRLAFPVALFACFSVVLAKYKTYTADDWMMNVCGTTLTTFATWCEGQIDYDYTCFCTDPNAMASFAGCLAHNTKKYNKRFKNFAKYCGKNYNVTVAVADMDEALELYSASAKSVVVSSTAAAAATDVASAADASATDVASASVSDSASVVESALASSSAAAEDETTVATVPMVDYPVLVDETTFQSQYAADSQFYGNYSGSLYYASGIYAYWALVLLVAAICNWAVVVYPNIRYVFNGRVSKLWRKYVTLPALFRRKKLHYQKCFGLFDCLLPSRLETLICMGFFWVTFIMVAINYPWTPNNAWYFTRYDAVLRYVADRTGIVATILLPLLFLFGGRNNFLQWVTGFNFATFIAFHRWVGRVIVSMVFVHTICYTVMYIKDGYYAEEMADPFLQFGVVGMVAGALMCFQGLLYLRRRWYEAFLVIHILLAVCFSLGAWKHVALLESGFDVFLYATVAVWCFDRVVRLARIFWFGMPQATVSLLPDECLRIVVPRPAHWKGVPGGHAWVYFCTSWYFWQSHPFTFLESVDEENQIVFLLKTKKGATRYVTKMLSSKPGKTCNIRVCVEGPYGEACPVEHHDNVVFVAGGNGIPGIFSEIHTLAQRSANNTKQQLKLLWILRDALTLEWMWKELHAIKNTKIQMTIYITRPDASDADNLLEKMNSADGSLSDEKEISPKKEGDILSMLREHFTHIQFKEGRPLMDALVKEEADLAEKSAAFVTCGHPIMVDDLRYAVVLNIDKSDKRLDFYEQLQVWA